MWPLIALEIPSESPQTFVEFWISVCPNISIIFGIQMSYKIFWNNSIFLNFQNVTNASYRILSYIGYDIRHKFFRCFQWLMRRSIGCKQKERLFINGDSQKTPNFSDHSRPLRNQRLSVALYKALMPKTYSVWSPKIIMQGALSG